MVDTIDPEYMFMSSEEWNNMIDKILLEEPAPGWVRRFRYWLGDKIAGW